MLRRQFIGRLGVATTLLAASPSTLLAEVPFAAGDARNPVRIGAIASTTGLAQEQGTNWLNGALMARDELEKSGLHIELFVENDQTNPASAVTAFHALASSRRVSALLGGTWDFLAEPLYPLVDRSKMPFITMTNPVELMPPVARHSKYIFTNALGMKATKAALRKFFLVQKPKRIALLTPAFAFTLAHATVVKELAQELHIEIVFSEEPSYDDVKASLKTMVTRLAKSGADTVCVFFSYEFLEMLTREMSVQRVDLTLVTSQHLDAAWKLARDKSPYRRAFGVYPAVKNEGFKRRYSERFGTPPPVYAAEGYDALTVLAQALSKGVNFASPKSTLSVEGVLGTYRFPAQSTEIGGGDAVVMTTMNGVFEEYLPQ